jgi:hypothetical protein
VIGSGSYLDVGLGISGVASVCSATKFLIS